jgi:peroxiredoxin Q/BCP
MVELRKRKIAPTAPAEPVSKKAAPKPKPKTSKFKEALEEKVEQVSATVKKAVGGGSAAPKVGDVITLEGFGGEFETQDGTKVTLKKLVDESKAGVVIFTYPKASTPGCKSTDSIALWLAT